MPVLASGLNHPFIQQRPFNLEGSLLYLLLIEDKHELHPSDRIARIHLLTNCYSGLHSTCT